MPPVARKRARRQSPGAQATSPGADDEEASASHLVSFLTGYADRDHGERDRGERGSSSSEGESSSGSEAEVEQEADFDDDSEDDVRTPSRRGLVGFGTPSKRRKTGTPASTPRRRTPGKGKGRASASTSAASTPATARTGDDEGFLRQSRADRYFLPAARSARTSGASYAALARPLSQAEYEAAANGARGGSSAAAAASGSSERVAAALESAALRFEQWVCELEAGFNLLLYGYGSKRRLVNRLVREHLAARGHCAVVNGHFPQLGLRDVLAALEDTLSIPDAPAPPAATPLERAAYRVYRHFAASPDRETDRPLFLVLHNIDAPALRTPRALAALALLASAPRIHIVATFDHVHTPLLFSASLANTPPHAPTPRRPARDKSTTATESGTTDVPTSRGFNWLYHSTPTYDDYDVELSYARLSAKSLGALARGSGITEEGALQILRSVPPMAARLLKLILTRQVAALPADAASHAAFPPAQTAPPFALDMDLLQRTARDRFIAREEDRFNAQMGEFRDHGLIVVAELDGEGRSGRWAWVPLGKGAIERILEEMKDVEA